MKERKLNRDKTDQEILQEMVELQWEAASAETEEQREDIERLIEVDRSWLKWRRGVFGNYRPE